MAAPGAVLLRVVHNSQLYPPHRFSGGVFRRWYFIFDWGGVVIKEPFCSQGDREWKALEMEKRVLEWVPLCSG